MPPPPPPPTQWPPLQMTFLPPMQLLYIAIFEREKRAHSLFMSIEICLQSSRFMCTIFPVYPRNSIDIVYTRYSVNLKFTIVCVSMFVRACAQSKNGGRLLRCQRCVGCSDPRAVRALLRIRVSLQTVGSRPPIVLSFSSPETTMEV